MFRKILGDRFVGSSELGLVWRNILRLESVPWIKDHEIAHDILFPAAGYITMVGEAIRQLSAQREYTVGAVSFLSALVITREQPEMQIHPRKLRLRDSLDF